MLRLLFFLLYLMASAYTSLPIKPDNPPPTPLNDIGGGLDPDG